MPELPEVESLRRRLASLEGRCVRDVDGRDEMVFAGGLAPEGLEERLAGGRLERVDRRGKYLLLGFASHWLLFSLRMTGRFACGPLSSEADSHRKLSLTFDGGSRLHFLSVRRLSRIHWIQPGSPTWKRKVDALGPDPLRGDFTLVRLQKQLSGRRGPLKPLLMNQKFVAGLGNIYASELCFRAGVDPRRRAPELTGRTVRTLHGCTVRLLREAVLTGGSSFLDFRNPDGRTGRYQRYHHVYDRAGERCVRCGGTVTRIEQAGRSTFYCPDCQT